MKVALRSQFVAAVLGGVVVALAFLALGITGRRSTQTIVEEAPAAEPAAEGGAALTPHAIYVRDAPGVVFVRAQVIEQVKDPFDLFPEAESSTSTGSGFLIDAQGHILTNYHVIEGADPRTGVTVQFEDDISRKAVVVGQDPDNDLAVLRVDMRGVPPVRPLPIGDSTTARVGDPILAIGNPFGLDRTLTSGIVSALQREIQAPNGFAIDNVIQTDAPINPGNSGGPLLDGDGRVIGINSQIETAANGGTGSVGISFAVPVNTAQPLLARLERGQPAHVDVGYLGVSGARAAGARAGVVVKAPQPGGPAATAGVRHGDVIEAISGRPVKSMRELESIVQACAGRTVAITIRRRGRTQTLKVLLGSQPASP